MGAKGQVGIGVVDPAIKGGGASLRATANAFLSTGWGIGVDQLDARVVDGAWENTSEGAMPWSGGVVFQT
jgi:hypothetical protein